MFLKTIFINKSFKEKYKNTMSDRFQRFLDPFTGILEASYLINKTNSVKNRVFSKETLK